MALDEGIIRATMVNLWGCPKFDASSGQRQAQWFDMTKISRSKSVPKAMQATFESITGLTDAFCRDHLNDEYLELAQDMAAALCRKRPSPVSSGQPRTWACGIIYALGQSTFSRTSHSNPS